MDQQRCKRWICCLLSMVVLFSFIPISYAENISDSLKVYNYVIEKELNTQKMETIYDGTVVQMDYNNLAKDGYKFLLTEVEVISNEPIDSDAFKISIDGKTYSRLSDDVFLGNHGYSALGHGDLLIASRGWIVFEVPEYAENPQTWIIKNDNLNAKLNASNEYEIEPIPYYGYADKQAQLIEQHKQLYAKKSYTPWSPYIAVNPYGTAPLTALIMFETTKNAEVTTTVVGKTEKASIYNTISGYNTHHELPIIGLYNGKNIVEISLKYEDGTEENFEILVTAENMPSNISSLGISLEKSNPEQLNDGLYWLRDTYRLLIDLNGDIRGYFTIDGITTSGIDDLTEDGHIIFAVNGYTQTPIIYEMDAMGFVYREVQVVEGSAHHDALMIDKNTLLTMDYELNMETGEISTSVPWFEVFSNNGLAEVRSILQGASSNDIHHNTISWCGDDAILVSARNYHAVAKLSYPDYKVEWILSVNPNASPWNSDKYLTPIGDNFEWFYSQHNPQIKVKEYYIDDIDDGVYEITLFDNGLHRGLDPNMQYKESEMYSRMVCYRIDEKNMTVEQVWDYGEELGREGLSAIHGSTQYIEQSMSYLGNFDVNSTFEANGIYDNLVFPSRVIEVSEDKNIIYDLHINDSYSYRVEKVTTQSLYSAWEGLDKVKGNYIYVPNNDKVEYINSETADNSIIYAINSISATRNYLYITGWAAIRDKLFADYSAAKIILTNKDKNDLYVHKTIIDPIQRFNSDVSNDITDKLAANTGFAGNRLDISTLPEGDYQIGILVCQNGNEYHVSTEKVLKIEPDVYTVTSTDILLEQQNISQELQKLSSYSTYTPKNPCVTVDPYDIAPLSAIASFKTDKPASISVEIESKNGATNVTNEFETLSTEHQIPIYGLYENEATNVKLTAKYQDGTSETSTISVTGKSLPSDFVPVGVEKADATQMADGWTFIMAGSLQGYIYAIDETGAVRWMLSEKGLGVAGSLLPLSNGNYLIGGDKSFGQYYKYNLFELNMTGQIINEYLVNGYHHDAQELPNGNLLILANNVNGDVVEDTMYEIERSTGAILRTWDLNSYFNVGNYNNAGQHVSDVNYGSDTHDWLHTNGMEYDESTNSVLISARHQDAVFSMSLETGDINWILSNPDDLWPEYLKEKLLKPTGNNFEWQYGQHNISLLPNGDIMMFDNGDYRSKNTDEVLPATEGYSRAVVYRIDKESMTVSQVWQFGKELGSAPMAAYVSSSQYLGENHYLIDFGGIVKDSNGNATYNIMDGVQGSSQSQIYEVKDGKIIFHASVKRSELHGNTYRAVRMMPYSSTAELDLTNAGNRLGSLYRYGFAETVKFDSSIAVSGAPDVDISDNGVQLQITSGLGNTGVKSDLAIIFANDESAYKVTLPSDTSIAYTLNNSEIPIGTYKLYLVKDNITYDLKLEWTNSSNYDAFPTGYNIAVKSNLSDDLAYGSGIYYPNTSFTISAVTNDGYKFEGWYIGDNLVSNDANYTTTATSDMTITAKFSGYTDVKKTDWYYDAVNYVNENGIMTGYSETQFAPNDKLSRAQACQVIYNIADANEQATEAIFSDVPLGQWYTNAISWASKNGVVSGYGNNLFGPDDAITREQMAAILYRYSGAPSVETNNLGNYTDANQISNWATDALNWCVENKIMVGNGNGTMTPNKIISRAEVATIMMNYFKHMA